MKFYYIETPFYQKSLRKFKIKFLKKLAFNFDFDIMGKFEFFVELRNLYIYNG